MSVTSTRLNNQYNIKYDLTLFTPYNMYNYFQIIVKDFSEIRSNTVAQNEAFVVDSMNIGDTVTMIVPVSPHLDNFKSVSSPIKKSTKRLFSPNASKTGDDHSRVKRKKRCDRRNCCIFCDCVITNLTRHMTRQHANEIEVAKYLALFRNMSN